MISKYLLPCALATGLTAQALAASDAAEWTYAGADGPDNWGELAAAYEVCKTGLMQSPIDLAEANAVGEISVSVDYADAPLTLRNSGKTVQVDFPSGSYLTSSGRVFELVQVHFHTPSEHTFGGATYPLVAHFVHASDEGALAVLGVLFEEGASHGELQKIIDAADGAGAAASAIDGVTLTTRALVPDDVEVFRYMGSLTTPPCSEGVSWHVAEDTLTASAEQLAAMEALMGMNARPVLPVNGRLVVAPE